MANNDTAPALTTSAGAPIADNQNSLSAGARGPLLLQDWQLIEKLAHQNRERIPERVVHAKGWGAYGTLTITNDISQYSRAKVFENVGRKTDLILRFSTVAGELGAADAERDVRGFALKFYTEEGNWDVVGNNTPVFFIRDPLKFPDFIHTQKRHPKTDLRSNTAAWDFWSLSPESLHQITILMSDRGLPQTVRHLNGYGSHTYSFWNTQGERFWVKFHFKSMQGHRHWTNAEAAQVVGRTRESTQEDLFYSIERGEFPKWRMMVQVMPELDAEKTPYKPVRPHQGLAAQGLSTDRGGRRRAEPQSRELLRRNRAGGVFAVERRAGHRLFARQDAAGADLRVRGRTPLPPWDALRGATGERAALPGKPLSQGWRDALYAEQRQPGRVLRAEFVPRPGAAARVPRAAAAHLG
jgi:hypothetical protein